MLRLSLYRDDIKLYTMDLLKNDKYLQTYRAKDPKLKVEEHCLCVRKKKKMKHPIHFSYNFS